MKLGPDGSQIWTTRFTSTSGALISGIDTNGNVIFLSAAEGPVAGAYHGGRDVCVGRCDPDGNIQWIGQYGSGGYDSLGASVLDSEGNLTWVGFTGGSWFGANQGGYDAYIAQIAADGTLLGGTQFGTSGFDDLEGLCTDGTDPSPEISAIDDVRISL